MGGGLNGLRCFRNEEKVLQFDSRTSVLHQVWKRCMLGEIAVQMVREADLRT